jgi:hypothetical protein
MDSKVQKVARSTITKLLEKWDNWHKHHEGVVTIIVIATWLLCFVWWGVTTYETPTFYCGPLHSYERNNAGEIVQSPKQYWACTYKIARR